MSEEHRMLIVQDCKAVNGLNYLCSHFIPVGWHAYIHYDGDEKDCYFSCDLQQDKQIPRVLDDADYGQEKACLELFRTCPLPKAGKKEGEE